MILAKHGELSTAQDLTAGSTDSENVCQIDAVDYIAPVDLWWVVETETIATGDASDTFKFQLVLSQESTLDTNVEILSITVTGYASKCLATAGRKIVAVNIGNMLAEVLDTDLSSYPYIGMISTISAGATVSINAALSPTKPPTEDHAIIVESNVSVPGKASAGS